MNILRREWKAGWKAFLFWTLGLFGLMFTGVVKSTGITSIEGASAAALVGAFPRIVQAVLGMVGLDMTEFPGFYAVLSRYSALLTAVYAVHLGGGAVSREAADKTYEFVFTKPRTRSFILAQKLLAGWTYLLVFCALTAVFSAMAVSVMKLDVQMTRTFFLFAVSALLFGTVFFAFAALFAAAARSAETGAKLGNYAVLAAFCMGVVHDMLENPGLIRLLSPFRYFQAADLIAGRLDPLYLLLSVLLSGLALMIAFRRFEKRDLAAA